MKTCARPISGCNVSEPRRLPEPIVTFVTSVKWEGDVWDVIVIALALIAIVAGILVYRRRKK